MNKTILLTMIFLLICSFLFGQVSNEKIMYVVDSIAIIEDPEEGNELLQADVSDITIITNKDSLKQLGYEQFDGLTYLFTKEYRMRPENIKRIPSSKQMERKDNIWFLHGNPYSGPFVDYYYSGKKQGEGTMHNGVLTGVRKLYYPGGKVSMERNYIDGIENGIENEYFSDGTLKQKGKYLNGKEEGVWESYFVNGQVKLHSNYRNGEIYDTAITYYSTGKIKEKVFIKNGKAIPDPASEKIIQLMNKSNESNKEGNIKAAIKYCTKAIELDSSYASAYFSRGTIKLNDFQFDEAIADFDKALEFEPLMEISLSNRAFARIRKYQYGNGRTLLKNRDVTVMASKNKVAIPENELQKVCDDLQKAVFLGDKSKMITEALSDYCQTK